MCKPQHYGINYSINPWMDVNNGADYNKSIQQWNDLEAKIKELGATVKLVEPAEDLPDMVFTANAALILKNGNAIVSHFAHKERAKEEEHFTKWFVDNGYKVHHTSIIFEGAGDALFFGDILIGGHGFRSDVTFYEEISISYATVRLVDPYFYHLDTCFCPLEGTDYMIWPGAFDGITNQFFKLLKGNEISVPENEARQFACNAVRIGRNVILPEGCPVTMQMLCDKGYIPHPLDMSEYIKSGGACKCLTLVI